MSFSFFTLLASRIKKARLDSSRTSRWKRCQLLLERLEDRWVPASIWEWKGSGSTPWTTSTNWVPPSGTTESFPNLPTDTVEFFSGTGFFTAAATATLSQAITVGEIDVKSTITVTISGSGADNITLAGSSLPGVLNNDSIASQGAITISAPISAPNGLNITDDSKAGTTLSGSVTTSTMTITMLPIASAGNLTISGQIMGLSGGNATVTATLDTAGSTVTSAALILSSASNSISSNSVYTVNSDGDLRAGTSQAFGSGATIVLNNGGKLDSNVGVTLTNNLVIGTSASVTLGAAADPLALTNSTISLSGSDSVANTSSTSFNGIITGAASSSDSLAITGTASFALGNTTFTGNPITLSGAGAFTINGSDSLTINTATMIKNALNGTGSLAFVGTSPLTLAGPDNISGAASINSDTVTLTGTDNFGGTSLQGASGSQVGTLIVDSSLSSNVTVSTNGLLRGTGSITGGITASGGSVQPGDPSINGGIGTLSASSASFTNGGTLVIAVPSYTAGLFAQLNLANSAGTLTADGTASIALNLSGLNASGTTAPGGIILDAPGSSSFAYPANVNVIPADNPNGLSVLLDYSTSGQVNLDVSTSPAFTSAGSATFDVGASSTITVTTAAGQTYPTITDVDYEMMGGSGLPTGVSFAAIGNGSAILYGSPATADAGNTYSDTFTATFNGNSVTQVFNLTVATATVLTDNTPSPSPYGQPVSFTATVYTNNPPITGDTVTLYQVGNPSPIDSMTLMGSSDSVAFTEGSTNAPLPIGSDSIYAVYSGDTTGPNVSTTSNTVVQVVQGTTSATLTDNGPNPSNDNQPVGFTVNISGGTAIAGETVTLYNVVGSTSASIGSGTLASLGNSSYSAAVTVLPTALPVGSDSIYAVYGGDSINVGSTSNQVVQNVTGAVYQWTGAAGNDSWSAPGNWDVNGVPQTVAFPRQSSDTAQFFSGSAGPITGAVTATLNAPRTVGEVDIESTFPVVLNAAAASDTLTLQGASNSPGVLNIDSITTNNTTNITAPISAPNGLTFTNQSLGATSISASAISASGPVNITLEGSATTSTTTISDAISSSGTLNLDITNNDTATANTISGNITAPGGGNINITYLGASTQTLTVSGNITATSPGVVSISLQGTGEQITMSGNITAPAGLNATLAANAGFLILNQANIINGPLSTYTVDGNSTLAGGPNTAEFGSGATIILNSGSTFYSNNGKGMSLTENFVIGSTSINSGAASVAFSGTSGTSSFTLANSTITLAGADTISVSTTPTGLSSDSVLVTGPNGSSLTLNGPDALTLTGSDTIMVNAPTVIQNNIIGTGSLTITGNSTLTLSGTDTYSGGTVIQSGTAIVDGSLISSAAVTVNAGGTLMGDGTVGAINVVGGTVQPGDPAINGGIGTLSATSASFTGGALVIQVAGYSTPGGNYDRLNLGSSTFNPSGSATIALNLSNLNYGGVATGIILDGAGSSSFANVNVIPADNQNSLPAALDYSTSGVVNLDVTGSPSFTSAASATFNVGSFGAFTPIANGYPAPTVTDADDTLGHGLPGGVTFTAAGVLSGTPSLGTAGVYSDTFFASNSSGSAVPQVFTLVVNKAITTTTLTDNGPNPSLSGQSVSFTVAVNGAAGSITGDIVTLYDGGAAIDSMTLTGANSVTFTENSALTLGFNSVSASFSGDSNNFGSTSNTVIQDVQGATTTTLTSVGTLATLDAQAETFTVNVQGTNSTPTGTVTLYDTNGNSTVSLGSSTLDLNGNSTIQAVGLLVGSDSIYALYGSDSTNATSLSNPVVQTIGSDTYQWTGANTGNATIWTNANNWESNGAPVAYYPNNIGDVAQFFSVDFHNGSVTGGGQTPEIPGNTTITVGEIDILSTQTLTIGAASGGSLVMQNPSGPAILNYEIGDTSPTTLSAAISVPNGLNITYNASVAQTLSSNITAPNGGKATISASINSGNFLMNSGNSSISSSSSYNVSSNSTFSVGASNVEIGVGATVVLNSGATFRANSNSNGVTGLDENFVIGSSSNAAVTFGGYVIGLSNSTIQLNGSDTIALTNTSATFSADFIGSAVGGDSLTLTGSSTIGFLGDATFGGANPVTLLGATALTVSGADTVTVNTPTAIDNNLNGTGSLTVIGNNALTLLGADTFTGGTNIGTSAQSGALIVDGSVTASAGVTVNQGSTLMGDGTVGAIAVLGGTVQPGDPNSNGGIGTLNASSATFTGGALVINVAGYATSGVNYDRLNLDLGSSSGKLTVNGNTSITLNLSQLTGPGIATGIILDGAGSSTFATQNINLIYPNPNPNHLQAQLVYNTTQVNLQVLESTTTTLTDGGPNPSLFGGAVNFTASVASLSPVTGDTVTLYQVGNASPLGSNPLGSSGSATITVTTLPVGSDSVYAVFSGDSSNAGSQSTDVVQVVQGNTTTTLTDSGPNNPSLFGGAVNFTASVASSSPVTGDTVTLYDASNGNTSVSGAVGTLNASGSATITVTTLPVGSDSIYAVFSGDSINLTSQSQDVVQVVQTASQSSTTTTLTDSGPSPALLGQGVTFTASVASASPISGETVTLYNGNLSDSVGFGTLTNGSATITVTTLPVGSDSIFAVYGGDASFATSQSSPVSQTVSGLISAMGSLPPVETSSQFNISWSGAAASGWSISSFTIYESDNFAAYAPIPSLTDTTASSYLFSGQDGHTYSFYSVANGGIGGDTTQMSPPSPVATTTVHTSASTGLTVTSFNQTATGFTAAFSEPFLNTSTNPIHLYSADASNANYGAADVTIVGKNTGAVTGSLIVNATDTGFTFIKTNLATGGTTAGLLAPDTYTVTFLSGPTGFQDTNGNQLNGNGNPGSNYVLTFTVSAPAANAVTVSIPDFARGPDSTDSINIGNNTSNGIPVSLSNGSGVTSGSVTVTYNPSLLTVTGAFPNPALGGASFTLDPASTAGIAILDFASSASLGLGPVTLGGLIAYTPSNAAYKSKELLQISSSLNGGAIPTINDNAVQVVAFLGNVSGTGLNYTSLDSGEMLNVISGSDAGFSQFPVVDPAILGGLTGDSQISITDILQLESQIANPGSSPYLPPYPGFPSNYPAGPDPSLSIPATLTVSTDGTVLVPVNIDDAMPAAGAGMTVAQLALKYDPAEFSVTPQDVQLGSVPESGTGWTLRTVVDAATGTIGITLSSETPISSAESGSLAVIALHELSTATPGATAIELVSSVTANGQVYSTSVNDQQGPFTLTPAPTNNGAAPGLEGTVVLGTSIPAVAASSSNAEQVAALPELATAASAAPATSGSAPAGAITDAPVGVIEDRVETTAANVSDIVVDPDGAASSNALTVSADHSAAALAPVTVANANVGLEAALVNGTMFAANAGPVSAAGGNPLFSLGMGPQSGNLNLTGAPGAGLQVTQHLADQLFQNLSLDEAGRAIQSGEAVRDWLPEDEQAFDPLSQNVDESAATDIGVLDGCFAQMAAGSAAGGD